MVFPSYEGAHLIQDRSGKDHQIKVKLLQSSPRVFGMRTDHRALGVRVKDWDTVSPLGHSLCSAPCYQLALVPSGKGKLTQLVFCTGCTSCSMHLHNHSCACKHGICLWIGPCLIQCLWPVLNETGKKIYRKCRTMNGTSLVIPEVTYTVFCYI